MKRLRMAAVAASLSSEKLEAPPLALIVSDDVYAHRKLKGCLSAYLTVSNENTGGSLL